MDTTTVKMIAEQANSIISQNGETYGGYSNVNFEGGTGRLIVDLKGDGVKDDIMVSIKQFNGLFVADTSRGSNAIVSNYFKDQSSLISFILSF